MDGLIPDRHGTGGVHHFLFLFDLSGTASAIHTSERKPLERMLQNRSEGRLTAGSWASCLPNFHRSLAWTYSWRASSSRLLSLLVEAADKGDPQTGTCTGGANSRHKQVSSANALPVDCGAEGETFKNNESGRLDKLGEGRRCGMFFVRGPGLQSKFDESEMPPRRKRAENAQPASEAVDSSM